MYISKKVCVIAVLLGSTISFTLFSPAPINAAAFQMPEAVQQQRGGTLIQSADWDPYVKKTLNDFLVTYGKYSSTYDLKQRPYAVFDFDNTTSIMDVEEQLIVWQLEHLAFAIAPDDMGKVLETGIPTDKLDMTYGADDGSGRQVTVRDAISDAAADYAVLYKKGLISVKGKMLDETVKQDLTYQDFVAKMRWLYDAISETMDSSVSYPWVTYWFTGMTPRQVYTLAYACDSYYGDPAKGQTWSKGKYISPAENTKAGSVTVSYNQGITVTPEVKELYRALYQNGIDVWIDSASYIDVVRAAVDYFAIPDVKGIVAMTNQTDNKGRYINAYNYDLHAQTQGVGKSLAIKKVIAPLYQGHGPIFTAMDSQGDFNFTTEFKDTRAVLIMNRRRKDDAALCAGIAEYQKKHDISLQQANLDGDTKFILQGRNENTGALWPDDQTLLLGKTSKVFLSDRADDVVKNLEAGASIRDILEKDTHNKDYNGYKTR
ncbi:haloacid dehalogenase-like hydrolase [Pectinatus frisingensis]|uniref:haloacid dehalogenase-like hydrolase n=1 Tax=Pectinatus frisingensis TaxID=865 RepID=UPI0015F66312|nr:haloacid dehalogenase-like hydrolase [Pectinatus frisingensis]